jgi:hypothetical protein
VADPIESQEIDQRIAELEARIAVLERARRPQLVPVVPPERVEALETQLGKYWLSRIGIVSLITGIALLIITYFGQLGPFVRVAVGYAIAAAVAWAGLRIARQHEMFGRVVFGGGLAIAYFVTYALHFVAALRVIDSEPIGVALVALAIAGIVVTAHRMRSETVAGIALFLGLHTGMLSEVTALSLIATTLLAAGAAFFLANNRWVLVPLSTVVAVYSTHATLAFGSAVVSPELRLAFVGIDFSLFAAALLIGPRSAARSLALLGVLNWLGALVLGGYAASAISSDVLFAGLCGYAVVLAAIAGIAYLREEPHSVIALQAGAAIVTLAIALRVELHGMPLVTGWLVLALVAAVIARRADIRFTLLSLGLVVVAYGERGGVDATLACVVAMFAIERWHAAADSSSPYRTYAIAGVALGLLQLAGVAAPPGFHVLGWVAAAFALFAAGFALRSATYRWAGFAVLALSAARLLAVELRTFTANERILTFVLGGIAMLAVSFVYARRRS